MITDPFAPLAPTPAITTAAEARAAGRAAQDNREVPLHDITGHMYAIGVPRSLHYAYLGGIDDSLERSEEHTSELQSLMRISYAVFCLKNKKQQPITKNNNQQ